MLEKYHKSYKRGHVLLLLVFCVLILTLDRKGSTSMQEEHQSPRFIIATTVDKHTEYMVNTFIAAIHRNSNAEIALCVRSLSYSTQSALELVENVHLIDMSTVRKFRIAGESNDVLMNYCLGIVSILFARDILYIDVQYDPSSALSNQGTMRLLFESGWTATNARSIIGRAVSFPRYEKPGTEGHRVDGLLPKLQFSDESKCFIRHKAQRFSSRVERRFQPGDLVQELGMDGLKTKIALGMPMNARGISSIDDLPLLKDLWPSFLKTVRHKADTSYIMLVAVDRSDSMLVDDRVQQRIKFEIESSRPDINVEFVVFEDSDGWVVYLWNGLFDLGLHYYGAHYFYQINDDFKFLTQGWADEYITKLRKSPIPFVGVTGPIDINNKATLTASFVSAKHYCIFGFYYPYSFVNWYSDDWIQRIYEDQNLKFSTLQKIVNTNTRGTRYHQCKNHEAILHRELAINSQVIKGYLRRERCLC